MHTNDHADAHVSASPTSAGSWGTTNSLEPETTANALRGAGWLAATDLVRQPAVDMTAGPEALRLPASIRLKLR